MRCPLCVMAQIVYASRCRRPRFESHLMEKPQNKDPQTSQCKSATSISPIFWFKCLSAGGAGTLPAEPVPDASKIQGATIAIFYFAFLLLVGRVSAQPAPEKCFEIIIQRLAHLSKIEDKSQKNVQNAPKIRPGRPSGQTRAPSCSSRSYKKLTC